jgi:ribonuclease Z
LQYHGKKIFISGDTRVDERYFPAMADADLVVHEALDTGLVRAGGAVMRRLGLNNQAYVTDHIAEYHADTLELAEMAQRARVKHLVLTHMTPSPDGWLTRKIFTWGMSDRYSGDLTVGEDGMTFTL